MHRALSIDEVVGEIFDCASRGTALALALSNRSFFVQGVRVIWSDASVCNLARTVPGQYWNALPTVGQKHTKVIVLSEEPQSDGWLGPRFRLYAGNIQEVTIGDFTSSNFRGFMRVKSNDDGWVHHSAILAWFHGEDDVLFPRLQRLEIKHSNLDEISATGLAMMHPGLRELRILPESEGTSFEDPISLSKFVANIQLRAPALQKLIFSRGSWFDSFPPVQHLTGLESWTSFTCLAIVRRLSENVVDILSTLPHLETLEMALAGPFSKHSQRVFPSLRSITITSCKLQDCMALLRSLTSRHLRLFNATMIGESTEKSVNNLLRLLIRHRSLEVIHINPRGFDPYAANRAPYECLSLCTTAPLLELSNITDFYIAAYFSPTENDDGLVLAYAQAWPLLERFDYITDEDEIANPIISLTTFATVLCLCPHLTKFLPALDIFSPIPELRPLHPRNSKIEWLNIIARPTQDINGADMRAIPEMLVKICPHINRFEHAYIDTDVPEYEVIESVKSALEECINQRNSEG